MAWWPDLHDYNDAIQYPDLCFDDPVLKQGTLALNGMLPRVASGNFATVYQLVCGVKTYAVKCFHRPCHPDQAKRYSQISDYLGRNRLDTFVDFEFMEKGIRVGGQQFPILKMEWVDGELLDKFVEKNHADAGKMQSLAGQFGQLMTDLKRLNIAHGDLQHGNVLVHKGQVKLIDYDGMFIPAFKGMKSYEIGHRNYQHPERTPTDFDANLDHFAAWVIYLSLMALGAAPELWKRVKNAGSDCLLFHQKDFLQPNNSQTLTLIENLTNATVRGMVRDFRDFLNRPVAGVPPLPIMNGTSPSFGVSATSVVQTGLGWLKDHFPRRDTPPPPIDVQEQQYSNQSGQSSVTPDEMWWLDHVEQYESDDFSFSEVLLDSEADVYLQLWEDTHQIWRYLMMSLRGFFKSRYTTYQIVQKKMQLESDRLQVIGQLRDAKTRLVGKNKERATAIRDLESEYRRIEAKIVELKGQIVATPALERDEIAVATADDRERHLKSNALKSGAITGFGAVRVQALNDMGIRSAADINSTNEKRVKQALSIVHRARPGREWRELKRWREDIETDYRPPPRIARRIREIERNYDELRSTIRQTINARQVELGIYHKRIGGQDRYIQDIDDEVRRLEGAIDVWEHEREVIELDLEQYQDITFERFLKHMRQRLPHQPIMPRAVSAIPLALVSVFVMIYIGGFIFGNSQADDESIPLAQSNEEWTVIANEIGGVEMVLVPRGCFFYGEQDVAKCIDEPFWIDRYEVTAADFGSNGAENMPRILVTWPEASATCLAHGGRLPTEIEWEFAARGPDSWDYVWGGELLTENEVYEGTIRLRPRSVTALGLDVSWVGAVGLNGNVAEWTSTLFREYPYNVADGREDQMDLSGERVVRGSSFRDTWQDVEIKNRIGRWPLEGADDVGFRCVMPYEG